MTYKQKKKSLVKAYEEAGYKFGKFIKEKTNKVFSSNIFKPDTKRIKASKIFVPDKKRIG